MRISFIHSSDWHLGQKLNGFDRGPEQALFLNWLLERMEQHHPDGLLVSGDIFDSANPPIQALEQFTRFAVASKQICPNVIFTAGNHDSAARLEALRPVFNAIGVTVIGQITPDPGDCLIPFVNRDGTLSAWVAAIPYLRPMDLPSGGVMEGVDDHIRRLHNNHMAIYSSVSRRYGAVGHALPLILMGHLYLTGGVLTEESERPVQLEMGRITGVSASVLPNNTSYAALGHLHRCQQVTAPFPIHYSGTPVPMSFSEAKYTQTVLKVQVDHDRATVIPVNVPRFQEMDDLTGTLEEILTGLDQWKERRRESDQRVLLRVTVNLTQPEPDLREQILDRVDGTGVTILAIRIANSETQYLPGWLEQGGELEMFTPEDVMILKYRQEFGCEPEESFVEAFKTLLRDVEEADAGETR